MMCLLKRVWDSNVFHLLNIMAQFWVFHEFQVTSLKKMTLLNWKADFSVLDRRQKSGSPTFYLD
jgi:hypothetical protein